MNTTYPTIRERIAAYRQHRQRNCVPESRMKKILAERGQITFDPIRYKAGSIVRSSYVPDALWLVVGHGFTGKRGEERGCYGCKITNRIYKRWEWIGPEKMICLATEKKQ